MSPPSRATRPSLAARAEAAFEAWAHLVIRFRRSAIALVVLFTLGLATNLPELRVDNSAEGFLPPDDPAAMLFQEFREQYGRTQLVLIAIRPTNVFEPDVLETLRDLHEDLESEVPYVDSVLSLVNARVTRGVDGELVIEKLLERWPEGPAERAELERRVLANPFYRNLLISENGRFTMMTVAPQLYSSGAATADPLSGFEEPPSADAGGDLALLSEEENAELVRTLREIVARYESPEFSVFLGGGSIFAVRVNAAVLGDLERFALLAVATVAILLFGLFGRVSGVVLPTLVVVLSVVSLSGMMALLGIPFSVVNEILPGLLITVGVCDSVHILVMVYRRLEAGDPKEAAIAGALGHAGLAILMTSVTTAAGLASFAAADLVPVAQIGLLAPIGIFLAFAYSVTLLPALLAAFPLRRRTTRAHLRVEAVLRATGGVATRHPIGTVSVGAVLLGVAVLGIGQLRFSHYVLRWFPESEPFRIATEVIDRELRGTVPLEVLVDTGAEQGLHEPGAIRRLEEMALFAESLERDGMFVGNSISLADLVKEIHQALNDGRPEAWVVPRERSVVAQELLLFEGAGGDDLEDLADIDLRTARLSLRVPAGDAMAYPGYLDELEAGFARILGDTAEFRVTGGMALAHRTFLAVVSSLWTSYALAFAMIAPMMVVLLGRLGRGIVAMIPNLTPVVAILGIMGWAGIPIDGSNLMVGAIILGLAVDDTIHFMHKFGRYLEEGADPAEAVARTLETTGIALLFTSLVLSAGFFTFTLGYMVNIATLGLLAGLATLIAFLADVTLAPALMVLVVRRERDRPR